MRLDTFRAFPIGA